MVGYMHAGSIAIRGYRRHHQCNQYWPGLSFAFVEVFRTSCPPLQCFQVAGEEVGVAVGTTLGAAVVPTGNGAGVAGDIVGATVLGEDVTGEEVTGEKVVGELVVGDMLGDTVGGALGDNVG